MKFFTAQKVQPAENLYAARTVPLVIYYTLGDRDVVKGGGMGGGMPIQRRRL